MAPADLIADEFRDYLERCDPETAAEIMSVLLQRPIAPAAASSMIARGSASTRVNKKDKKKQKHKQAKSELEDGGPKRPLNSWMAFRKYYLKLLSPRTQKAISRIMTLLWRADPFEAKWAILAKAYSIVRGCREKKDAPLDEFFDICAPLIGVIPPEEYLGLMGWQLGSQDTEEITRVFIADLDGFPEEFTTTTLSVDDLVARCYAMGYVNVSSTVSQKASTQGSLTMVSRPAVIASDDNQAITHIAPFAQTSANFTLPNAGTQNINMSAEMSQGLLGGSENSPPPPTNVTGPLSTMVAAPAGQVTLERATNALAQSGAEYPYNSLFDPASQFDVSFDPAATNEAVEDGGRWDAYDLSMSMPLDDVLNLSWEDFINDDGQS